MSEFIPFLFSTSLRADAGRGQSLVLGNVAATAGVDALQVENSRLSFFTTSVRENNSECDK